MAGSVTRLPGCATDGCFKFGLQMRNGWGKQVRQQGHGKRSPLNWVKQQPGVHWVFQRLLYFVVFDIPQRPPALYTGPAPSPLGCLRWQLPQRETWLPFYVPAASQTSWDRPGDFKLLCCQHQVRRVTLPLDGRPRNPEIGLK